MKRRGFSVVDVVVIVATLGAMWAIIYPVFRRPLLWSRTPLPALRFQNAELAEVVGRLDAELASRRKMKFLGRTRWSEPQLKHRRITLETPPGLTMGQVLSLIEKKAGVVFERGGSCGTCGFPDGPLLVVAGKSASVSGKAN